MGRLGGAERSLLDVMAGIRQACPGWDLHLVSGSQGALISESQRLGVKASVTEFPSALARAGDAGADSRARLTLIRSLCTAGLTVGAYVRALRRAIRRVAPDIIHTNGFKMHILALWARPASVPVLWHVRDYVSSRPVMAKLLLVHSARCAAAVANSESVAADLRALCGGLAVYTVYNAVDLDCFSPVGSKADLDALAGLPPAPPGTVRVGLVATAARWKGHEIFLKALSLLPADVRLRGFIIGGPLYETVGSQASTEELRSLAKQFGLSDRVGFTGFVENPAAAFRALDIVVHASTQREPFGRVIAEGMACAKPVISTGCGGVGEIVSDGIDSMTYPAGDPGELAKCIRQLGIDTDLRSKLGAAGRAAAEKRFDRERLASELIAIYSRVNGEAAA